MQYGLVFVTIGTEEEAKAIASTLVEMKLAACVSIAPTQSVYRWQGQIDGDREWQLTIKTDLALFSRLEAKIQELHSYEVPEIIAIAIVAGSPSYLNWMDESMQNN
ncbi:divalent-cation tolerance protein CutA [Spirulina sp. 06S082]|uniref:divalent-cation tolerance protein CutA n=1 Tax=Spirulina sp. 06S082 TaxID=3110248 RepID=UPI002B21B35D|nr:divalent-cation tolerance protein CutA [Spirulina sp. 06S082]MEA5469259.1 divalent-cation tolerance protein CutA [Spirulina sp. 06S082]